MQGSTREGYQFGDSDLAAERLRLLAEVFEPSSRTFLQSLVGSDPRAVLDLGCGPGFSTRLLAEVFPRARVTGVDSSQHFVELARGIPAERVSYEIADVTQPIPGAPYDLMHCRYLLTHVPQPAAAVERWSAQLRPSGVVTIEENAWIRTDQPAFARYLEIVAAMLVDAGQQLYVGAELDRVDSWCELRKRSSEVTPVVVGDRAAARMFLPNLQTWRNRRFVARNHTIAELDRLHDDLEALAHEGQQSNAITFGLQQLVLAKRNA